MQRLGELNNKVIVEQKTAPENKYVIWKDPVEGKFKEYKDGSWIESEEIAVPGSGSNFPYEYENIYENIHVLITDFSEKSIRKIGEIDTSIFDNNPTVYFKNNGVAARAEYGGGGPNALIELNILGRYNVSDCVRIWFIKAGSFDGYVAGDVILRVEPKSGETTEFECDVTDILKIL